MVLRIGICAPYDLSRDGGVNSHVRAQARALRALGHDVRVFGAASGAVPDGEVAVSGSITFVVGGTETPIGIDPLAWFRVGRLFATARFDLVHVHEPLMPLVPWWAVLRARVPIVGTFHVYREQGHRFYPRARRLLSPLVARLRKRIAVSNAARETVARYFPGDYEVVPNGIECAAFADGAARPAALDRSCQHVLYVGRLEPRKGVSHLVDAMPAVHAAVPHVRLIVVGDGPDRDALTVRARERGVDARFVGRVSDTDLPAFYRFSDLVCAPAVGGESFGIVLLEAMAAGRPVVATQIDGYRELAGEAGGAARLVPPGSSAAIARELIDLLGDAPRRARLGAAGAAFAARFDWTVVARRLEAIYYDVLMC